MFILLFGLMGVAAIFPVGNHYAARSDRFDRAAALADNAFADLRARGLLRSDRWVAVLDAEGPQPVIAGPGSRRAGLFAQPSGGIGSGHAFVIDPLGYAAGLEDNPQAENLDVWPRAYHGQDAAGVANVANPWTGMGPPASPGTLPGTRWPIRRVTYLAIGNRVLPARVAELAFSLRDDLAVELPLEGDRPGVQRWNAVDENATLTPENPSDDRLLARAYDGAYTWLATVVPHEPAGLSGLQPADRTYGDHRYDVSVAVYHRRDALPGPLSERSLDGAMLPGGELVVYATAGDAAVDAALDEIREGEWLAVTGVHRLSGMLLLKWYRILAVDNATGPQSVAGLGSFAGRRLMLDGPDWPGTLPAPGASGPPVVGNLRVVLTPGVVSVTTRSLKAEAVR